MRILMTTGEMGFFLAYRGHKTNYYYYITNLPKTFSQNQHYGNFSIRSLSSFQSIFFSPEFDKHIELCCSNF